MRSRNYFAVSSLLVFTSLACDSGAEKGARIEDKKEEAKPDDTEDLKYGDHAYSTSDISLAPTGQVAGTTNGSSEDDSGGAQPVPDCPKDQARLENGSCDSVEKFSKEQEILDDQAVAEMQQAKSPKQVSKAQGDLIQHQSRQIEQVEKDLDEIIAEVKKRKEKGGMYDKKGGSKVDPFD
jgi:hypothetical protein